MVKNNNYVNPSVGHVDGSIRYDSLNNRISVFEPRICQDMDSLERIIRNSREVGNENNASRIFIRGFVPNDFISQIENLEGHIPLQNNFEGYNLIYLGENSSSRRDRNSVDSQLGELLSRLEQRERLIRDLNSNYIIERLDTSIVTNCDVEQIISLGNSGFDEYCSEFTTNSVYSMIENSPFFIARCLNTNEIASMLVGEIATIETDLGEFRLAEESEMVTSLNHRGHNLASNLVSRLTEEIHCEVDIITAEARANHGPAIGAFINSGFQNRGTLYNAVRISGESEIEQSTAFGTLQLMQLYGGLNNGN